MKIFQKYIFGYLIFLLPLLSPQLLSAQQIDSLKSRPGISFRGLSVVNNNLVWVSGSKGTVGRSADGGKTFNWFTVKGYEKRDFRDIEAFDAVTAVILAVDSPGVILRTYDGGASWQEVYRDDRSGIFLDAMDFRKDKEGMVISDPINGRIVMVTTANEGKNWVKAPDDFVLPPDSGEACFASSGSNISVISKNSYAFVTGGLSSRYYNGNKYIPLPLIQKGNSTGANSLAVRGSIRKKSRKHQVVVGGDFMRDTLRTGNAAISSDGGKTWTVPEEPPFGYRSSVVYITRKKLIACGTSGVDISTDGGNHWRNISRTGYHVCQKAKDGRSVFLAGGNGRMAKLDW